MQRRAHAGFTLVELMIVLVILATLSALAAPSMSKMIRNQRVKTASFDTFAGLVLARSEAIKRNTSVTLTPVNSSDWSGGWTTTDSSGAVLARQDPLGTAAIAGPASVTFNGSGRLSAAVIPKFDVSAPYVDAAYYRCIKVDLSGRPISSLGACP
ncbi:MAG: GspH/FimT family pseudopilin [Usitatibacter sp.]